jgi:alpha-tubulin suppressor-like RCC1 family protein
VRRIGLALLLIAAGLVWTTVPANAVAQRAGARTVTPAITAGADYSCASLANGTAKCWGFNRSGQLGNGTTTDALAPVTVTGLTTATAISAGWYHSCAVLADGTARCWGFNGYGQLGDGTNIDAHTPVGVNGVSAGTNDPP